MHSASQEADDGLRCCLRCHAIYRTDFARCPADGGEVRVVDTDPLLGVVVGPYLVDTLIGEGGVSRVYRAHHTRLERRQFALKVLLGDFAASLTMRMRFAREAEAASRLDHPNVVAVVDYGKTPEGLLYLAMELVDGRSLAHAIYDDGPMPAARVIALARQLCLGLGHAHDHGLVHRDFKPGNVIIVAGPHGEVPRIVDFGLAISQDPAEEATRVTSADTAMGTPAYAAPEQVTNTAIDHRADLFALGITLYEMLAGKVPFDGGVLELMHLNATRTPPPIAERSPGVVVPPRLEAVIQRLIQRRPADRFASAADVIAALDALDEPVVAAVAPELEPVAEPVFVEPPTAPPPVRRRSRAWIVAPVLAVGALAAAAVYVSRDDRRSVVATPVLDAAEAVAIAAAPVPDPAPEPALPPPPPPSPPPIDAALAIEPEPTAPEPPSPIAPPRPPRHAVRTASPPPARPARPTAVDREAPPDPDPVPTPPIVSADPPPAPPPLAPVKPTSPPPPPVKSATPPPPVRRAARVSIQRLSVEGPLADAVMRRALDRITPALTACWDRAPPVASTDPVVVKVHFTVGETRRAASVGASSSPVRGLSECVAGAVRGVRAEAAPDVGEATVSFEVAFVPVRS